MDPGQRRNAGCSRGGADLLWRTGRDSRDCRRLVLTDRTGCCPQVTSRLLNSSMRIPAIPAAPPISDYTLTRPKRATRSYDQSLLSLDANAYWALYPQTSQVTEPELKLETVPSPSGADDLTFSTRS